MFFRSKGVRDEDGYVMFVRKNALEILVPKYGLQETLFLADRHGKSMFTYNELVSIVNHYYFKFLRHEV